MTKAKDKKTYQCPFCDKSFSREWRLTNHIRQSRTGEHGPMGDMPKGFDPDTYLLKKPGLISSEKEIKPPNQSEPENMPGKMNVEVINPPIKSKTDILLCPDCNTPKTEWIAIRYVDEATAEEKRVYDYMCPSCKELIRLDE